MTFFPLFLTTPPQDPLAAKESHACVCDMRNAAVGRPASAIVTARSGVQSGGIPTATLRSALRALASEMGPQAGLRSVRRLRPLVAQAHEILRERLEMGGRSRIICTAGRVLRTAPRSGCSILHRWPWGYGATAWSHRSRRWRRVDMGGANWPPAPISMCSFSCPQAAALTAGAARRQQQRASTG